MNPALIQIAIRELPDVIALVRVLFKKNNPDDPVPTDAEVMAAFEAAYTSSLQKDAAWLAAHPE